MIRSFAGDFLDVGMPRRDRSRLVAATLLMVGAFVGNADVADAQVPRIKAGRLRVEMDRFLATSALGFPISMAAPDDGTGRLFFVQKGFPINPKPSQPPYSTCCAGIAMYANGSLTGFLDLSSEVYSYSESGMLGMAFHPEFANPGSPGYRKFYTYHSTGPDPNATVDFASNIALVDHHNVVTEWQVSAQNPNVVDLSSRREIFREAHPSNYHNAGQLTFGPDGYLYGSIGTPDGDTQTLLTGQDNSNILGTIWRIDPLAPNLTTGSNNEISANGKYRIPADNPFVNEANALGEIYAYGLRNAFQFSIDPVSGLIFAGDVGDGTLEEVNVVPKGGNMGWPYREGTINGRVPAPTPSPTFVSPIAQYTHEDGTAVIGGHVYRGSIPALQNKYIFGDFSDDFFSGSGKLLVADVFDELGQLKSSGDIVIEEMLFEPATCGESVIANPNCTFDNTLISIGLGADGELYAVGFRPGNPMIYKITDAYELPEGDYNEDGTVDAADYVVWRDSFGQNVRLGTKADGDGDGIIGQGDYAVWKAHFGDSIALGGGNGSAINVPGPPAPLRLIQLFIALVAVMRTRRFSETAQVYSAWVRFVLLRRVSVTARAR